MICFLRKNEKEGIRDIYHCFHNVLIVCNSNYMVKKLRKRGCMAEYIKDVEKIRGLRCKSVLFYDCEHLKNKEFIQTIVIGTVAIKR